jgi:hypothetical protein
MTDTTQTAAAAAAAALPKNRERFRKRAERLMGDIYDGLDKLEACAKVRSYDYEIDELHIMQQALTARAEMAFRALHDGHAWRHTEKAETPVFSFEKPVAAEVEPAQ